MIFIEVILLFLVCENAISQDAPSQACINARKEFFSVQAGCNQANVAFSQSNIDVPLSTALAAFCTPYCRELYLRVARVCVR